MWPGSKFKICIREYILKTTLFPECEFYLCIKINKILKNLLKNYSYLEIFF